MILNGVFLHAGRRSRDLGCKVEQIARVAHGLFVGMRHFFEGGKFRRQVASLEVDECAKVAHLVAVVGGGENSNALSAVSLRQR